MSARGDGGPLLRLAGEHEEQVGATIEVAEHLGILDAPGALQGHGAALCATHEGAREVDGGAHRGSTGDDEAAGKRYSRLEVVDLALERVRHLGGHDIEVALEVCPVSRTGGELGPDHEELALQLEDARSP